MSYILDALRRADAERERGAVPGIHAQPVPLTSPEAGASASAVPWRWIAVASGLALLLPLAWQWVGRETPVARALNPAPVHLPPPVAAPVPAPAAVAAPAPSAARSTALPARAAPKADAPQPARQAKAVPTNAPEERRVVPYGELPDEVRRKLPRLVFGGSIHSDQASDRILIVNSQLLREGETAAPGVVLEQIKRQSAVFKFGDHRYEISY